MNSIYLSGYDIEFYKSVVDAREREAQSWQKVRDALTDYVREHGRVFDEGDMSLVWNSLADVLDDVIADLRAEKVDRARSLMQELPTEVTE